MTVREYFSTIGSVNSSYIVNLYENRESEEPVGVLYNAYGESIVGLFGENYILDSSGNDICIIVPNANWDVIMARFQNARISVRETWE